MRHQIFENQMFALGKNLNDELNSENMQPLREHLAQCDSCYEAYLALDAVNHIFLSSPMAEPKPGFVQRFEMYRIADDERRQMHSVFTLLAGMVAFSGAIAVAMVIMLFLKIQVSHNFVITFFKNLIRFYEYFKLSRFLILAFSKHNIGFVPLGVFGSVFLAFLTVSIMWMFFYKVFATPRRVI